MLPVDDGVVDVPGLVIDDGSVGVVGVIVPVELGEVDIEPDPVVLDEPLRLEPRRDRDERVPLRVDGDDIVLSGVVVCGDIVWPGMVPEPVVPGIVIEPDPVPPGIEPDVEVWA